MHQVSKISFKTKRGGLDLKHESSWEAENFKVDSIVKVIEQPKDVRIQNMNTEGKHAQCIKTICNFILNGEKDIETWFIVGLS